MKTTELKTSLGNIVGNEYEDCDEYLNIPFARAKRFEYGELVSKWDKKLDGTKFGYACPQYRIWHPHLENAERRFYQKEFRKDLTFEYDEDCLNLNIYTPKSAKDCPVVIFFHGGGFNSGCNAEEPFRGNNFASKGVITVIPNYRVGVLGYFTHEEIYNKYHRDGNFGLDDQLLAIKWVKEHINEFGGDSNNITLMGQSAGAISIQYLCLNHHNEGLFNRAIMMSGGGMFPKFALPKKCEVTHEYWLELMELSNCKIFEEFKNCDLKVIHDALEVLKTKRNDSVYITMPTVDKYLIEDDVDKIINNPIKIDYMLGYTNNDLYAPIMAYIGNKYAKDNDAYVYYFDIDSPGDKNGAFHSSDLRYMFKRLETSWRPYTNQDYEIADILSTYISNFIKTSNPNDGKLPLWTKANKGKFKSLSFKYDGIKMRHPSYLKMTKNLLTKGNPKDEI